MKLFPNPSRRTVVRAMTLVFACAVHAASAQTPRADDLKVAADQLDRARGDLSAGESVVAKARAELNAAVARRQSREKQLKRIMVLCERACGENDRLVEESEAAVWTAQHAEHAAGHHVRSAEARQLALAASAREAEALVAIARVEAHQAPDGRGIETIATAQTRAAAARLNHNRAEFDRARADVQAEEERQKVAAATVASRVSWLQWLESSRACAEPRLLHEVQDELRMARYGDRLARAQVRAAKAQRDALAISVREAEALLEIARLDSRQADDDTQAAAAVVRARARVAAARHDRPGAELEIARAEVQLAEERQKSAVVTIDCRSRQVERLRELVDRGMVEQKILDDEETRLAEAREARRLSVPAIEQAHARLKSAEGRLKAADLSHQQNAIR